MSGPQSQKRRVKERERKLLFSTSAELFEVAKEAHRNGELDRACELYRKVIGAQPNHADALHLLGFAEFQSARFAAAIPHLQAAVSLSPENGEFHNNLALAHLAFRQLTEATHHVAEARRLGYVDGHGFLHVGWELFQKNEMELAESAYQLSILAQPESADAHHFLGVLFAEQRNWDAATDCYRRALDLQPTCVEVLNNLGNAFRDQNRIAEAIPFYERAVAIDPQFSAAHNNLGVALAQDGQIGAAIECYKRALQWQPTFVAAFNNLGNAYRDLGQLDEAIAQYHRALQIEPRSAEIVCNIGTCLHQQRLIPQAASCLRRAVMLDPTSVRIHQHLATALSAEGRVPEAVACCEHLIKLDPHQPFFPLSAASFCPAVYESRGEMDSFRRQFMARISALRKNLPAQLKLADLLDTAPPCPFAIQFLDGNVKELKRSFAGIFQGRLQLPKSIGWVDSWKGPPSQPRIGIVVSDGHEGIFLKSLRNVIVRLSDRWELVVFCSYRGVSQIQSQLVRPNLTVTPMPTRLDHIAHSIADARCDLLYYWETGTDAINYFLPFLRLAPVQITSWGVQVTSGTTSLDAYVSSELVEPSDAQDHYTERLVLARSLLTYRQRAQFLVPVRDRDSFGAPAGAHWYVCAQQLGKFHPDFDTLLAGILRRDPNGAVILTADEFPHHRSELRNRFAQAIPDVSQRIHFLPRLELNDYFSLLYHAEVLLDPPHFGGVNSTYDGLSLNKPIVAIPSGYHRGRYTLGCYRKIGFMDCVTDRFDQYIDLAVRIGTDAEYRHDLTTRLSQVSDGLFEDPLAVTEHERIFDELLQERAARA